MKRNDIYIQIDRLILQGIDARERLRITKAIERELSQLIIDTGVPSHWHRPNGTDVSISQVTIAPGQAPALIGANVARAIYRGGN